MTFAAELPEILILGKNWKIEGNRKIGKFLKIQILKTLNFITILTPKIDRNRLIFKKITSFRA